MTRTQSVVETPAYLQAADDVDVNEAGRVAVVDVLAADFIGGEIMPGCRGAQTARVARRSGGKSGDDRVLLYYACDDVPVLCSRCSEQ